MCLKSMAVGYFTLVSFLFVLLFLLFEGLPFRVRSDNEALFSFVGGEEMGRGYKMGLVIIGLRWDTMELRLMDWF